MASYNSDQLAQIAANSSDFLRPAEVNGRVRVASFSYTIPGGGLAAGDTVKLCNLPEGATILGGSLVHDGLGNTIGVGVSSNYEKYLAGVSSASATKHDLAASIATKAGQRVTALTSIYAKALTGAWTAGKKIVGAVLYSVD